MPPAGEDTLRGKIAARHSERVSLAPSITYRQSKWMDGRRMNARFPAAARLHTRQGTPAHKPAATMRGEGIHIVLTVESRQTLVPAHARRQTKNA
jgi:hypothetical protein